MPALALTDHGNLYGAIEFYKKSVSKGIKPIIGVEVYVAQRDIADKTAGIDDKRYHLTLLAETNEGYKNLLKLVTTSHLEGFYYKPRVDKKLLKEHAKGLIALSGCVSGEIPRALGDKKTDRAKALVNEYREIFGKNNFFIEISHHPNVPNHNETQKRLKALAEEMGVPLVATQDIHYLKKEDSSAQDILLAIQTNTKVGDSDRMTMKNDDFSLLSTEEMKSIFSDTPDAIKNTVAIADRVDVKLELGKIKLPFFEVPEGFNADTYIEKLAWEGLKKRFGDDPSEEVKKRLEYEIDVIKKTGFSSYLLIVQDFVNWAKSNGIVVGPGRGSAAGSLLSYSLNITNIDPVRHNLLFERFMNPERVSPPDIDIDFADTRRDEVIEYASQKYGRDHVAQIITFGTMAARAAVRDAGRATGFPYSFCDEIAKMIPFGNNLEEALESNPDLKTSYDSNADTKKLIDSARKLEGVARHASVHACGVVISKDPLNETIPLQYAVSRDPSVEGEKTIVTQYEMHAIEDLGLLKMDFLGLKNLSTIESTLNLIKKRTGLDINIDTIPLDDESVFALLSEGKTVGVFQLEGGGMTRYLVELGPTRFEDIIAMVALFRPGPMELIPRYIERKHGREPISYLHPKLKNILEPTYGVITYQEQLMQIAQEMAGFSLGEADLIRKAVGKKIKKLLDEQSEKFIQGVEKTMGSKTLGNKLWKFVEPFARYGFNKAHSAGYALVAYQTAYLKTHFPVEFLTSLLNSDEKDVDRINFLVKEANALGMQVLAPDINMSDAGFSPQPQTEGSLGVIRFGLRTIKNVGANVVDMIINERKTNGPYRTLAELLERLPTKDINKKSLEALIKSGAMDALGERNQMLENMENILLFHKEASRIKSQNQNSLFGSGSVKTYIPSLKLNEAQPAKNEERLRWEKELLGLYISGHPLDKYKKLLLSKTINIKKAKKLSDETPVILGGIVENIKKIITKKGEPMAFMRLLDLEDSIEVVIFPRTLKVYSEFIAEESGVVVKGKMSFRNNQPSIIADALKFLPG